MICLIKLALADFHLPILSVWKKGAANGITVHS